MTFVVADRTQETSTTTGTGTYDLAGALTGFQTFVAGIGTTNTCYYCATDGTDWEVGIGTVTDATPDTLARTTVLQSSNADAAVSWGAGTRNIFCTFPAAFYSEGTWTPALTFVTPGDLSVTYDTQTGSYTKIGRLVTVSFLVDTATFTHTTASGGVRITGLPFTAADAAKGAIVWQGITKANYTHVGSSTIAASTSLACNIMGSGQVATAVTAADMPTGGSVILQGTLQYEV